jgi:hypothetical protein
MSKKLKGYWMKREILFLKCFSDEEHVKLNIQIFRAGNKKDF